MKMVERIALSAQVVRNRNQRIETRVTPGQKELIERAASVQGRTVTDFVITAVREAAQKAIEENNRWKLSQDQQKAFVDALMNPPAANKNLRAAYRHYKKAITAVR